ncbi:MAG: sterol desaturase family protein [Myxococcales bacterium FL481]|nr:MAG: sterol desaturase family protein [Myxococcales bacterium FL481]
MIASGTVSEMNRNGLAWRTRASDIGAREYATTVRDWPDTASDDRQGPSSLAMRSSGTPDQRNHWRFSLAAALLNPRAGESPMTDTTYSLPHSTPTPILARYLAYPALLAANGGLVAWALVTDAPLDLVTLVGLLGSIAGLAALERVMPFRREWNPTAREGWRDTLYFTLNGALDAVVKLGIAALVGTIGIWDNGLHLAIALPLAVLIAEFAGYWMHRFGHAGWLWKVHGVHHTPDKVNTWNNNTIHFINTVYSAAAKTLPLALLGFHPDVVLIAAFLITLQSFAVHANIDVDAGPLNYLIMTPVHHRLHHSTHVDEAQNFGSALTLWDVIFGTFVYQPGQTPTTVGVVDPRSFPNPLHVLRNQLHPFVDQSERAR